MQNSIFSLLTLMLMSSFGSAQSNTHFSHTLETGASPEKIWQIWSDVPNWNQWDEGLKSAELQGVFALNAAGVLIPDKGPKSKFRITNLEPGHAYTFKTKLPLGALHVKRFLEVKNGRTFFTHEVWFTGITKGIFGNALGKNYRKILPGVMGKIKRIAEQ
ncbi:MAG: SRPBCC family protein [Haliscomenobacter sp.]|nr:SRPBCC family protein [Haliscomenobacter sp.]